MRLPATGLNFDTFVVLDDGVFMHRYDRKDVRIASPLLITQMITDEDDHSVRSRLEYKQHADVKQVLLDADALKPIRVLDLIKFGIEADPRYKEELSICLQKMRAVAPVLATYSTLGWHRDADQLVFQHHERKGLTVSVGASYNGNLEIAPHGTFDAWCAFARQQLVGSLGLEIVLGAAVAAMVSAYAQLALPDLDVGSAIVSLTDESSTGKTTAVSAAMSIFGLAKPGASGSLFRTFNATGKAIVANAESLFGVPLALDELGAHGDSQLTEIVYALTNGYSRERLSETSKLEQARGFSTWTLSTGEISLRNRLAKASGLAVRLFELTGVPLTKSAAHAECIKGFVAENYGTVAPELALKLLNDGPDEVREHYQQAIADLRLDSDDPLIPRLTKQVASILMGVRLLNQVCQLGIDDASVIVGLKELISKSLKFANPAKDQYLQFVSWVETHKNAFGVNGAPAVSRGTVYGSIWNQANDTIVQLAEPVFNQIVAELGLSTPKTLLKRWKHEGLTVTESNRVWWRDSKKRLYARIKI
ncbi:DUF927 domain-containing protein [Lacticaseibacillus saniviri]